jgi:AhpD family alkylhydroperoxidase
VFVTEKAMQARIRNPATIVPDVMGPMTTLGKLMAGALPEKLLGLVHLRASQINSCAVCIDGAIGRTTETPQRLAAVAVWREAPFFTDAERAALALAEAITRMADTPDPVTDAVWAEAARHYNETELSWLVLSTAIINMYNRVNVATKQVAGQQRW